jgi:hypothetical protein
MSVTLHQKYLILTRGFKNVSANGHIFGFQLNVRSSTYRGIPLSIVEGVDVTVDGETFSDDKVKYSLRDRVFTVAQLATAGDVLWPFGQPLTLIVAKPGGLTVGLHDVRIAEKIRISYLVKDEQNPAVYIASKKITLVI